jgi:Uma2 family endonuclease
VTCGPDKLLDGHKDTLVDATVIVEVLSPSTRNYDRGEKFQFYRSLPSFAEYLLLAQDTFRAEHHVRQPNGS